MENTDTNKSCGFSVADVNEDSVDIYDGLDVGCASNAGKSSENVFQLKESMDLYEELVTEEQQSRESSYTELQSRFLAAQNQIKELHRRLEQLEMQNTGLRNENCRLKKNISALLQTARQEVIRKDAEIQRLNHRSVKGRHPFHIHNLQGQTASSLASVCSSSSRSSSPHSQPSSSQSQQATTARKVQSGNSSDHPTDSCTETRHSKTSSHSYSKSSSTRQSGSEKHKSKHREENDQSHKQSHSSNRRYTTGSNPSKNGPTRSGDKDSRRKYESSKSKSKAHGNVEGHHRSDRTRSPPPASLVSAVSSDGKTGSGQEHRQDKAKLVPSDSEHGTANGCKDHCSREKRKLKTNHEFGRSADSKDPQCRNSSKDREREGPVKDSHRKEAKRHEDEVSGNRKRSRDAEKMRSQQSDKDDVKVCGKERQEKKNDPEVSKPSEKSSVQETTPSRKLSFMETLNLTLSPIKKPVVPSDAAREDPIAEKVVENQEDHENVQPNVDDLFVIDEVDSSEAEAVSENAAPSLDICSGSHRSCHDAKDTHEKDESSGRPLLDDPFHAASASSPGAAKSSVPSPQRPAKSSPQAPQWDVSEKRGSSIRQLEESGAVEAAGGLGEAPISMDSDDTAKTTQGSDGDQSVTVTEPFVGDSKVESPKSPEKESLPEDPVDHDATVSQSEESAARPKVPHVSPPVPHPGCQQVACLPSSLDSVQKKDSCDIKSAPKDSDSVTSTMSLELLPQEVVSLPEAIYILTKTSEDAALESEPSSSSACVGVSKVSSTTVETFPAEKVDGLTVTPKKSFCPRRSHEPNVEPSSSVPLLHDEDSMMETLKALKRFPDVISPLRSPVQTTKRSHLHVHSKPGHVKSLQSDFSNAAVNSKKLDVNKENKYPAKRDLQSKTDNESAQPLKLSDTELEEGEILSESDEAASGSPAPVTKRAKLSPPVRNKASPKVLKRKSEDGGFGSKETGESAGGSTRSPKSRFKTVCPAATKTSFSSIEEIMEIFKLVRIEIRKKYMKLHKTFPKKSFYGMMDNFQESFLEFVDGAQFGQICSQAAELKSKLKKLIASVFSKVSNNGIVKRIFEQQAVDLKQKLWDFVDVQVDYLFLDIHVTLKSLCKPARAPTVEDKRLGGNDPVKVSKQTDLETQRCQQEEAEPVPAGLSRSKTCAALPYKTGLGSRGKDIRITHTENVTNGDPQQGDCPNFLSPKNISSTPEKNGMVSLIVSQNGSLLDKTDFEILTEQQASSLTFNLVRDSQMGEIFKCLLQGSDLLESSGISEEHSAWSLGTPKKDGERLVGITTPTKFPSPYKLSSPHRFETPSKLVATWSSISPRKMLSPRSRDQIPLNPALFDESCLLEVPSNSLSALPPHKSYSVLAEDLAVSLTIPSPLKSDSHLSFLQPLSAHVMSTPDSVLSAHISEDALLDGEDATEQDIHLSLDTDNSSCCSSNSAASVALATSFVFQTDKPMQALVMEKSNDHFIVKIRQAAAHLDVAPTADDGSSRTLREDDERRAAEDTTTRGLHTESGGLQSGSRPSDAAGPSSETCPAAAGPEVRLPQDENLQLTKDTCHQTDQSTSLVAFPTEFPCLENGTATSHDRDGDRQNVQATADGGIAVTVGQSSTETGREDVEAPNGSSQSLLSEKAFRGSTCKTRPLDKKPRDLNESTEATELSQSPRSRSSDASESEKSLVAEEEPSIAPKEERRDRDKGRKRRKHQGKAKAKRSRKEDLGSDEEGVSTSSAAALSPNSFSAKNVVWKKGEVVMAWSRDEDRTILVELKKQGPSRETFSALSEKLNKPSGQIAHRFYQLIKLFKKQEKMDT